MEFTERTALERGFADVFAERVRPPLLALEDDRLKGFATARKWMAICLAAGIGLSALVLLIFQAAMGAIIAAVIFMVIAGIGAYVAWYLQASGWNDSVAQAVMPVICDHIGDLKYDLHASAGFPVERMRGLGIVGGYNEVHLSDRLEGMHRDTSFEIVEARLAKETRDSDGKKKTKTVFRGLMFRIGVPIEVPTRILITRDFGAIGNKLGAFFAGSSGRGMPKVELDHARFEEAFEVHAEDPNAALSFMPEGFLDSLLGIGEGETGSKGTKAMRAGFEDDSFWLALSRGGDFLKMGSLSTSVANMEVDLHAIFSDIEMVHRIIDRLHGDKI